MTKEQGTLQKDSLGSGQNELIFLETRDNKGRATVVVKRGAKGEPGEVVDVIRKHPRSGGSKDSE